MKLDDTQSILSLISKNKPKSLDIMHEDPWSDRKARLIAFKQKDELFRKLSQILSSELNKQHGENFSKRYWEIIYGSWLRLFMNRVIHYWTCLEKISDRNSLVLDVPNSEPQNFVPLDQIEYESISRKPHWNQFIIAEVAKKLGFQFNIIKHSYTAPSPEQAVHSSFLKKSVIRVFRIMRFLSKKEVVMISTYTHWYLKLKLMIRFKELPYFIDDSFSVPSCDYDLNLRKELEKSLSERGISSNALEECLISLIAMNIPKSILEGYSSIKDLASKCSFPKNPKTILTTWTVNNEIFRFYVARKTEEGTKLCILCHGGEHHLYSDYHDHELEICDRYFTWGWEGYSQKHFLGFCQLHIKKSRIIGDESSLLLILTEVDSDIQYFASIPSYEQYADEYLNDQIDFINNLNPITSSLLNVRLAESGYSIAKEKIKEKIPQIHFLDRAQNLEPYWDKAKILVISYNETAIVKALSSGKPTVVFFRRENNEMNEISNRVYEDLKKCGIFHDSPISASLHINDIWNNVEEWWNTKEVIQAVSFFNENFCRKSPQPEEEIYNFTQF